MFGFYNGAGFILCFASSKPILKIQLYICLTSTGNTCIRFSLPRLMNISFSLLHTDHLLFPLSENVLQTSMKLQLINSSTENYDLLLVLPKRFKEISKNLSLCFFSELQKLFEKIPKKSPIVYQLWKADHHKAMGINPWEHSGSATKGRIVGPSLYLSHLVRFHCIQATEG